jgi:alanine racemase
MFDERVMRDTRAVIDLSAVADSIRGIAKLVGRGVEVMAVVKADGYGHGAVRVARTALASGATRLAVAYAQEAVELREAGVSAPILVLGNAPADSAETLLRHDLVQSVCDTDLPRALSALSSADRPARVHVKVDTGMGRIGVMPEDTPDYVAFLRTLPNLIVEGIFTHFPKSDEADPTFTNGQIGTFTGLLAELSSRGVEIPLRHMANSGGVLAFRASYLNLVRPGIMIYGLYPSKEVARTIPLREAMSLVTRIRFIKRVPPGTPVSYGGTYVTKDAATVATLPVGYADGYRRLLSNRYEALVRGARVPIIGRVCMDMTMIDVTHVRGAAVGDEVVLIGKQGDQEISIDDMADALSTINYEITCLVGKRVPRVYING